MSATRGVIALDLTTAVGEDRGVLNQLVSAALNLDVIVIVRGR